MEFEELYSAGRRCPVKAKGAWAKARPRGPVREGYALEAAYGGAGTARLLPAAAVRSYPRAGLRHSPLLGPGKVVSPGMSVRAPGWHGCRTDRPGPCPTSTLPGVARVRAGTCTNTVTSSLTHLGGQGASPLMLMAKSRHKKPEYVRKCFRPSAETFAEGTSLLAPGAADGEALRAGDAGGTRPLSQSLGSLLCLRRVGHDRIHQGGPVSPAARTAGPAPPRRACPLRPRSPRSARWTPGPCRVHAGRPGRG